MYSEWSTIPLAGGGKGVLDAVGGKDVVLAVVKQLASSEPSPLTTDSEVEWVLEVVRYGLSLPLSQHEAIRECVRICCAWLSPLLPPAAPAHPPPPAVPQPVRDNPTKYAASILKHLHNLFVPRPNESGDLIGKQAVLCHRVLRLCASVGAGSALGAAEWRALLVLLLSGADALLAPGAAHHAAADQLCERVLAVLFQMWILASHRCFPSPPLWRTLRELCLRWRHRAALTQQWTRASLALTLTVLKHYYPNYPVQALSEEDAALIPPDMSCEAVTQTWYRILHTIGNPVDLSRPHVICRTPHLLQYSLTQEQGTGVPSQHPCLQALPSIFHMAMKGVAAHVDAFLGVNVGVGGGGWWGGDTGGDDVIADRPEEGGRRSFSVSGRNKDKHGFNFTSSAPRTSLINLPGSRPISVAPTTPPNSITSQAVSDMDKTPLPAIRPTVNSLFHLFGEWLFEAALIGTSPQQTQQRSDGTPPPPVVSDAQHKLNMMSYQPGRSVAVAALVRVAGAARAREAVLPAYRARLYAALHRALRDTGAAPAALAHAHSLFRVDLDGILVLVPDFIWALERILPETEPKLDCTGIDKIELRKSAINILLSIIAYPYHYKSLPVPEFPGSNEYGGMTVGSAIAGRVALLALSGLQAERLEALAAPQLHALYLALAHHYTHAAPASHASPHSRVRSDGGGSGGGHSLEDIDNLATELDPNHPAFGTALVVRATYLVCHRLISSWKGDLQVSLAALELLSCLAKWHSDKPEALERKRAVRWICDYISLQCSRPPPAHSRDLHSCVVAAYSCLSAWLCPALLQDPECMSTLIEVVELGMTGSKSVGKPGEPPKMKDEKEIKPVSMRVRDAAESLLMLILDQSDHSGERCRLDERWLADLGHSNIRHYVVDGTILLSLLEEPLANSQEPQPTLCVIVRAGWGRWAWSLSTRGAARSARRAPPPSRPLHIHAAPALRAHCATHAHHHAPDSAFPSLESVLRQLNDPEAHTLFKLLDQQAQLEKKIRDSESHLLPEECIPPEPVTEFQTARLFLSNFGFLNIEPKKKNGQSRLVALDSAKAGFAQCVRALDATSTRVAVTVHLFFVPAGRTRATDIVAAASGETTPAFINMLRGSPSGVSLCVLIIPKLWWILYGRTATPVFIKKNKLGKPVRVAGHSGWTGHVDTSYDAPILNATNTKHETITPSVYDGREQILYWSDATSEIAFIVPSEACLATDELHGDSVRTEMDGGCLSTRNIEKPATGESNWDVSSNSSGLPSYERSVSESEHKDKRVSMNEKMRALSLELDKQPTSTASMGSGRRVRDYTTKILIIWLEDDEDQANVPIEELVAYCGTGQPHRAAEVRCLLVHGLRGGLCVAGGCAPTQVLSPAALPAVMRRAALQLNAAVAITTHQYQPPHVRRRHLIQELCQNYRRDLTEPELLESLFHPPG